MFSMSSGVFEVVWGGFPRTIPVWNSLPSSVVLSKTIEEFKASI